MSILRRLARQWESPPVWLALFLAAAWAQSRFRPVLDLGLMGEQAGVFVIGAGLLLMALAVAEFWRHQTSILPREVAVTLITTGVYRFSRNPIYLADAVILAGAALIWDAASLVLVPVFMVLITLRFIRGEEVGLRASFGRAFDAWAARTRRWI